MRWSNTDVLPCFTFAETFLFFQYSINKLLKYTTASNRPLTINQLCKKNVTIKIIRGTVFTKNPIISLRTKWPWPSVCQYWFEWDTINQLRGHTSLPRSPSISPSTSQLPHRYYKSFNDCHHSVAGRQYVSETYSTHNNGREIYLFLHLGRPTRTIDVGQLDSDRSAISLRRRTDQSRLVSVNQTVSAWTSNPRWRSEFE